MQLQNNVRTPDVNLPFVWVDAVARDKISQEHLLHAATLRNGSKYRPLVV